MIGDKTDKKGNAICWREFKKRRRTFVVGHHDQRVAYEVTLECDHVVNRSRSEMPRGINRVRCKECESVQ